MFSRKVAVSAAIAIALAGSAAMAQVFVPTQPSTNSGGMTTPGQAVGPFTGAAPFNPNMGFTPGVGLNSGFTTFANTPGFTGVNGPNPFNVAPGFNGFIPNGIGGGNVNPALANQTGFLGVDAFGNPLFVPGFNTVPQSGFTNGFMGSSGLPFGFTPGIAANPYGYYSSYYGPYGGAYPVNNNGMVGTYDPANMVRANTPGLHPGVPIAGVNAPPLRSAAFRPAPPGGRFLVKTDPKTPEDLDRARRIQVEETPVGTTLEAVRGPSDADLGTSFENDPNAASNTQAVYHAPATRDQVMLVQKAEQLMADRPMLRAWSSSSWRTTWTSSTSATGRAGPRRSRRAKSSSSARAERWLPRRRPRAA